MCLTYSVLQKIEWYYVDDLPQDQAARDRTIGNTHAVLNTFSIPFVRSEASS